MDPGTPRCGVLSSFPPSSPPGVMPRSPRCDRGGGGRVWPWLGASHAAAPKVWGGEAGRRGTDRWCCERGWGGRPPAPVARLRAPALLELGQDRGASRGISLQATPALPPGVILRLNRSGRVAPEAGGTADQCPGSGGRRANPSCRDVPDRAPGGVEVGPVTSVFTGEGVRVGSSANTLAKSLAQCGTSFVSSGKPAFTKFLWKRS